MGVVIAYLRSLADGQKVAVRVATPQAEQRFEEGRRYYFTRMGQQNYACASCHVQHAGAYFGDTAIPAAIGAAVQWPHLRDGNPETLQMRIRECLERMGAAPFPAGLRRAGAPRVFPLLPVERPDDPPQRLAAGPHPGAVVTIGKRPVLAGVRAA